MAKLTPYELEREANIARNKKLLESLGLNDVQNTILVTKEKTIPKGSKKRKSQSDNPKRESGEEEDGEKGVRPRKAARVAEVKEEGDGEVSLRRSSRNSGKAVDYKGIEQGGQDRSARSFRITKVHEAMEGDPRDSNMRTQDPKQYGHIPGVDVGTWWESRQACSNDAIHAPWVGGISCGPKGAYSIALSGGYDDDIDLGNGFTYTGSGGRDLKGTKEKPKNLRTAPQSSDQSFDNHFNKALKISSETKQPVRVIRGFKLHSPFAPVEGYRYDGLYTVEKSWQEIGRNTKYLVCKFAFKRLPDQPPLPKRNLEQEAKDGPVVTGNRSESDEEATDEDEETRVESTQETGSSMTQADDDDDDAEGELYDEEEEA